MDRPGSIRKWIEIESRTLHSHLAVQKKSLKRLLEEDDPRFLARDGNEYTLDKEILRMMAHCLSDEETERLKLPITLSFDLRIENQCYVSDELAAKSIRCMENFKDTYRYRNGKMWIPASVAGVLIRKYGCIFQRIFIP